MKPCLPLLLALACATAGEVPTGSVSMDVPSSADQTTAQMAFRDLASRGHAAAAASYEVDEAAGASGSGAGGASSAEQHLREAIDLFEQALALEAVGDVDQLDVLLVLPVLVQRADRLNARGDMARIALPLHARAAAAMPPGKEHASARALLYFNHATALYYVAQSGCKRGGGGGGGSGGGGGDGGSPVGGSARAPADLEKLSEALRLTKMCPAQARRAGQPAVAARCDKFVALLEEELAAGARCAGGKDEL